MQSGRPREVLEKAGTVTFCCMLEDQGVASHHVFHPVEGQNLYHTLYKTLYCISKRLFGLDCSTKFSGKCMCTLAGVCVSMGECVLVCLPAKFS